MREHRTLAASGGAGGVQDRRQFIRLFDDRLERVGLVLRARQQRAGIAAVARLIERKHVPGAGLERDLRDPAEIFRCAHHHRRFGIRDKIGDLGGPVGSIERQIDQAGADRRKVQHQRFGRLLDLHRNPCTGRQMQAAQQVGHLGAGAFQIVPAVKLAVMGFDAASGFVLREARGEQRVEVGVHA